MSKAHTFLITIAGLIQGVGFRPFVYRIAQKFKLNGWVNNTNISVQVCVNANEATLLEFINQIQAQAPPASQIESVEYSLVEDEEFTDFRIIQSENISDAITEISPDISVCENCLRDMKSQSNRIDYPFLNCTNCGPRFTIVQDLPYDRNHTTMQDFEMCDSCRKEYEDVEDRRFHAQPTACADCGPLYTLVTGEQRITESPEIIQESVALIDRGGIIDQLINK